jgi:hypothetical protein
MSTLFESAVAKVRKLPARVQNKVAIMLMERFFSEAPTRGDKKAITEGQKAYKRGDYISLD